MTRRLAALLALTMAGCSPDPLTELVVVINSDMASPGEFDGFRVVVTGNDAQVATDRSYFLGDRAGQVSLPADFGITPKNHDASRRLTVEVFATLGGATLFSTRAVTGFVEGKSLRLDMFLAKRCLTEAAECQPNETCRVDGCVPEQVDPAGLPEFDPNAPLSPEASTWLATVGSSAADSWMGVAADTSGNVYAAGIHGGDISVGGTQYPAMQTTAMIAGYDAAGKVRWFKSYQGQTLATASGVAAAADGKVYATGWFDGQMQVDDVLLDSGGYQNSFLACYDAQGQLAWAKSFGDQGNVQSRAVSVAPNGDVAITGVYPNVQSFGGAPIPAARGDDVFVARFDSAGTHLYSWGFGGETGDDWGRALAFDSQSNLVLGGYVSSGTVDFGGQQVTFSAPKNAFVMKVRPDGSLAWVRSFESGDAQNLYGLAVGPNDEVAIAGAFPGTVDFGEGVLTSAGDLDAAVAIFDADGNPIASTLFGGAGADAAYTVAFSANDVIVAGSFSGEMALGPTTILGATDQDGFVLRLSPDLSTVRWAHALGGAGADSVSALAVAGARAAVAGQFSQTISMESVSASSAGGSDAYVLDFAQ